MSSDYNLSNLSTEAVDQSLWNATDFVLAAGCCILQPETEKIVIVHDNNDPGYYFLPRGRKDPGESLETTALREAYEESGYRAKFLPILMDTRQPIPPDLKSKRKSEPNNINHFLSTGEPIYIQVVPQPTRYARYRNGELLVKSYASMYIAHWYVGYIGEDAVRELGTGMPDEQGFESELMTMEEALKVLRKDQARIVTYAFKAFKNTRERKRKLGLEYNQAVEVASEHPADGL